MSLRRFVWWVVEPWRCRDWFVCGYGRDVLPSGLFPPRNRTEEAEERPRPPYQPARSSACCIRPPMSWPERLASRRIVTVMTSSSSRRARMRATRTGAPDAGSMAAGTTVWAHAVGVTSTSAARGCRRSTRPCA